MEACVAAPPASAADGTGPQSPVFSLLGCRGLGCLQCDDSEFFFFAPWPGYGIEFRRWCGLQILCSGLTCCSGKPVPVRIVMQILSGRYVVRFSGLSMRQPAQVALDGRSRARAPW